MNTLDSISSSLSHSLLIGLSISSLSVPSRHSMLWHSQGIIS